MPEQLQLETTSPLNNEDEDPYTIKFIYLREYNSESERTLHLSEKLRDQPIFQAMFEHIRYQSTTPSKGVKTRCHIIKTLFDYVDSNPISNITTQSDIIARFAHYLSSTKDYAPGSIRATCSAIRVALTWGTTQPIYLQLSDKKRKFYLATISKIPSIPRDPTASARIALSQLVDGHEVDDLILLNSLNHFCWHFLGIMQRHREILTNDGEVAKIFAKLKADKNANSDELNWNSRSKAENYRTLFDATCNSDDLTLKERLLCSSNIFRTVLVDTKKKLEPTEIELYISNCIHKKAGTLRRAAEPGRNINNATFANFDFKHLSAATEAEEICLRWLMAADRIQDSGQKTICIDDILVTTSHCTITYEKRRSGKFVKTSSAYRKKTWQYKIYKYYLELRKQLNESFPTESSNNFYIHLSPFNRNQHFNSISYRLLAVACLPHSHLHNEIIEKSPQSLPFIQLMTKVFNLGTKSEHSSGLTNTRRILLIPEIDEASPNSDVGSIPKLIRNITTSAISQSRAVVDDDEPPTNTPFDRYAKEQISADSTAHSVKTKEFIYKHRSETIHRKNKRSIFSNEMNKLQESDARKLSVLLSETTIVSIEEMKKLLKWPTGHFDEQSTQDFNAMIDIAEAKGYSSTPFGAISKNLEHSKIIVKTPITVALMLSYRDTCNKEIEIAYSAERAASLTLQSMYVSISLEAFDNKILEEGRAIHKNHTFPNPLID